MSRLALIGGKKLCVSHRERGCPDSNPLGRGTYWEGIQGVGTYRDNS